MKYIRTFKGKIVEVKHNMFVKEAEFNQKYLVYKERPEICITDSDGGLGEVVKEAKTIEELCDCFVYKISPVSWRIFNKPLIEKEDLSSIRDLISWYGRNSEIMYGAIETDKGLIYVAKANEKGVLELL